MNIPKQKISFYLKNVFIASLLIPVCNQDVTVNKPWGGRRHCSMTVEEEKEFLNKWENIATGGGVLTVPPKNLSDFDAQRIVKNISDDKKKPRTAQYVMATLRQIWNKARRGKIVSGDSPTRNVKIKKFDNRRQRFLSHTEAALLLAALKEKDETVYKMALLSLHTGMRASEIFKLTWGCVDTQRGIITILDAKSGKGRPAFMTEQIKNIFNEMKHGNNDDIVFLRKDKNPYTEIPTLFRDMVTDLKFNENVSDTRQRVCFHTLRHTMASWHAEGGTDLYILKELLGHGSITLTERYSHLSNGALQEATRNFGKKVKTATNKAGQVVNFPK
ncbi:MAG: site-specific integrase [Smithella sp.]